MAILLGVDTGGTYTDAVLVRDDREVLASAKALTTRDDLARGIAQAVRRVLDVSGVVPEAIGLAALSTTLATNALVEGHGQRAGLVFIGFAERDLAAQDLRSALAGDPVLLLAGGHNHAGTEVAPLDLSALEAWAGAQDVASFAVAAQFATRNPAHELAARDHLLRVTGRPVTCSHELSARLGGPKRALTALLNARLIGLTHRLIGRAGEALRDLGIAAPLMVVRGDGALMSAAQAMERPIETILSGPAASIVGARWLTGVGTALVSDIGGTTTDIALLRDGRPAIDPEGARVGRFRTMVEAVAMRTHGLGGDSEVHLVTEGLAGGVTLGPGRVVPLAMLGAEVPDIVAFMDDQLRRPVPSEQDGRFVRRIMAQEPRGLSAREAEVLARIPETPVPLSAVLRTRLEHQALSRLVARGLAMRSGVTPTDAVHVLGRDTSFNAEAARLGLELLARRRTGNGDRAAPDAQALAERIVAQMTAQTAEVLVQAALAEDGWEGDPATLARHPLLTRALTGHRGLLSLSARLDVPVVGLGASATCYYPAVGEALGAQMILPEHAGVANAIGAVVGRVTVRRSGTVTAPSEGRFRAHLPEGPQDFASAEQAMDALRASLSAASCSDAVGAEDIALHLTEDIRTAEAEGRTIFLEATVTAEASGRPRIATG